MRGANFMKMVVWGIAKRIPGHPRKNILGRARNSIGRLLIAQATPTSVFAPKLDLRSFNISIGENSGLGYDCLISTGSSYLKVGNNVTMGSRVIIACNSHSFYEEKGEWKEVKWCGRICIEDDCFIGSGAIILGGVTIGRRSIVAAGAVVTKDVSPHSFIGGVPAKRIRSTIHQSDA